MTTKRFKKERGTFWDKDKRLNMDETVELLNDLHEENEQLKERIKELQKESYGNLDGLNYYQEQNGHLSSKISDLECENERLREENNKLHTRIFEMRTNIALERTEISKQTYTGKKNKKEYLNAKEFLDEMEKW